MSFVVLRAQDSNFRCLPLPLLLSLVPPPYSPLPRSALLGAVAQPSIFMTKSRLEGHAAVVGGVAQRCWLCICSEDDPGGHLEKVFDALERLKDQHAVCLRAAHLFIIKN